MKEISVLELRKMMDEKAAFQLIDVREPYEVEICEIGGVNIPMAELPGQLDQIRKDVPVIIHCRSGARSANMINYLEATFGYSNLYNLKGGILEYAREIDPDLATY
ncbi:MAG TPA: rhodanese-like domain-containing protein [Luteibaculaceae bacterium]|nr:rhodanese-like domain-containing protein [Luteibaculaceae bacterium]